MYRALKEEEALLGVLLSVDTFQSSVAQAAVSAGADIVNDVSGGLMDDSMFSTVRDTCLILLLIVYLIFTATIVT